MRLFRRRAETDGEVGRIADPTRHQAGVVPPGVRTDRDELTTPETLLDYDPRAGRSWRAVQTTAALPTPGLGDVTLPVHMAPGRPDERRTTGIAGAPRREDLAPSLAGNTRVPVQLSPLQPLAQPSAGATTLDATRGAEMPRYLFIRDFDQVAEYAPPAFDRIYAASPVASQPLHYAADAMGEAYAGGSGRTVQESVPDFAGRIVRWLPSPHDDDVTAPQVDAGMSSVDARARRGWR